MVEEQEEEEGEGWRRRKEGVTRSCSAAARGLHGAEAGEGAQHKIPRTCPLHSLRGDVPAQQQLLALGIVVLAPLAPSVRKQQSFG